MNSESNDNFDQLRRLLALKRHEQPPPGYFNQFSRHVLARIRAGDDDGREGAGSSWFHRFWGWLEARPVFAGAFGAAFCGMLVSGVLISEGTGVSPMAGQVPASFESRGAVTLGEQDYPAQMVSTNSSVKNLFEQLQFKTETEPVTWTVALPGN